MDRRHYLEALTEQIRTKRARTFISEEIENHIDDQKQAFIEAGMNEQEAEEAAVLEMGDPVEVGVSMDRIHRPKMEWRVLIAVLFLSILGIGIQYVITHQVYRIDRVIIQGVIGLGIMMAVCFIDYSWIEKWAPLIWVILHLGIFVSALGLGRSVNGRSELAVMLAYLIVPFYAGLIYNFRGKGIKGFAICFAGLILSVFLCIRIPLAVVAFIVGFTGFILLQIAIGKGWFGAEKKTYYGISWGAVVVGGILCYIGKSFAYTFVLEHYQHARIDAILTGNIPDNLRESVGLFADSLRTNDWNYHDYMSASEYIDMKRELIEYARNDYVWTYVFHYLGNWKGILLLGIVILILAGFLYIALKQKNRLGYIVGTGCALYLCLQTLCYLGANVGLFIFNGSYMPLISHGMKAMVATYFYMGLLLSICRNEKVVKN